MSRKKWTKAETIVALRLYCVIPFNRVTSTHPEIIRVAKLMGRSVNSLKMKIGNFGSFDPELKKKGIVGLAHTSRLDKEVWDEYNHRWEQLFYDSERIMNKLAQSSPADILDEIGEKKGRDVEVISRVRTNQSFFRQMVLAAYNNTCAISGLQIPELLIASHIIPWRIKEDTRLNPSNGICLNALYDRAFDRGLLTITPDFKVKISPLIRDYDPVTTQWFLPYHNKPILLPERFIPDKEFLRYHNQEIFRAK